ncbi:hypothetical protein GCM10009564_05750 [Streptomyces thermogriseus]|uniref:Uncharacterized protein n=1 Tax=Streptomyces thermogriseus TaxID=75292 RepID=A0ABN1STU1_9ACTN
MRGVSFRVHRRDGRGNRDSGKGCGPAFVGEGAGRHYDLGRTTGAREVAGELPARAGEMRGRWGRGREGRKGPGRTGKAGGGAGEGR